MSVARRLGVLGWPVAHSRSPQMMNAALAAAALEGWRYQRLPAPPELFAETVKALPAAGFLGANVTIPHKPAALALADEASDAAAEIGAANTLSLTEDGRILAENTDAGGLLAALGFDVGGASALVLGAGGSARAAIWALSRGGAQVSVWNRTFERAQQVASELGGVAVSEPVAADLLVNCTSVGLERSAPSAESGSPGIPDSASDAAQLNQLGLDADQVGRYRNVFDLVYSDADTALLRAARAAGARTVDGIEMLVQQGALSFELWTKQAPPLEVMRAAARRELDCE
jgi:shikimate dehydrogenase